ncbi:MAG: beta-ketoacyl synthase [Gammaproteobacteria bacterium]|nr:beta-ketoacyl synthase [Gammaproteobacteria bacterium]MBU1415865.1 beta-ketoacyl synthase [Gammaproteobacteria bacterium]
MTIHVAGRGLACSLGADIEAALATLRAGGSTAGSRRLPGGLGGEFPYFAIRQTGDDWYARARDLVVRVADEAGAARARNGTLFIATSSFDIGAVSPEAAADYVGDYRAFVDQVAGWLEWSGPVIAVSTACTSALNALISAQALLESGAAADALVLGIELENSLTLGGFAALQLLSRTGCKPFGRDRDGLVLGEAVAALRLSTHAESSWRLLGGANVVDGSQPTGAAASAVTAMLRQALARSGLAASEIDLVKVQAAGSPGNDAAEAQGLREAFERMPALVSLKAAIGHTMGAAGAAEIALLLACLEGGVWPIDTGPTDPQLGVDLASRSPEVVRRVMATILGFGGSHAGVVLERA